MVAVMVSAPNTETPRRQSILAAALTCFLRSGVTGTTIEAIQREFALIQFGDDTSRAAIPQRLLEVAKSHPTMVAEQELDVAKDKDAQMEGALGSARENVHESQAELGRIQAMVDYATITAPFSGIITKRFADTGALIQAGTASDRGEISAAGSLPSAHRFETMAA